MAIFVTGAGGFLGQNLVDALIAEKKKVLAFDYNAPEEAVLNRWKGLIDFCQGDIRDKDLVADLIKESGTKDPIIHLAGVLTKTCEENPDAAMDINVNGTYHILTNACARGKRRVVFASTFSVYGPDLPQPVTEDMMLKPASWYGLTKMNAEQMGMLFVRRYGLDFRGLRFAALMGPRRTGEGSASLFTSLIPERAAQGKPYEIEVTPDTGYPVVYIKDAVEALLKSAFKPEAKSRIYNIAAGKVTAAELVEYVKKAIPEAQFTYKPAEDLSTVVSGYQNWTLDCSKAKAEIGWTPSYTVEQMADALIAQGKTSS